MGSTMTSVLQSMVLVLLHRNGNLCLRPQYSAASSPLPHGLAWSLAGVPKTPPLVMGCSWLALILGPSSSSEPRLARAPREDWLTSGAVCRCSGNGGPQTCLPVAHSVAKPAGRTAHLHQQGIQDPREGPSLARRTTQDLLGSGLTRLPREERRYQGGANLMRLS